MRKATLFLAIQVALVLLSVLLLTLAPVVTNATPGQACRGGVDLNCPSFVICEWESEPCSAGEYHVHMVGGAVQGDCPECDIWAACLTYCPIE